VVSAPCQVRQEASGVQRAERSPVTPSGSYTHTWPMARRSARVAWSTSGLTEVETTGPSHSSIAGMTTPTVLWLPGGP
jgi:hypothetical protein